MFVILEIGWFAILLIFSFFAFIGDVPAVFTGFLIENHGVSRAATYTEWGYTSIPADPSQQELIKHLNDEEMVLKHKAEDNRHDESLFKLGTKRIEIETDAQNEQVKIIRAYRLSLFRWACFGIVSLTLIVKGLSMLDNKDNRKDNRLYLEAARVQSQASQGVI